MSVGSDARLAGLDRVLDDAFERGSADRNLVQTVVAKIQGAPSPTDLPGLGDDLFAVVDALDSSVSLRRALTDPGTSVERRQQLARNLLDGKVSKTAVDLVAQAVGLRWAGGRTMTTALERQAVRAQLLVADASGQLEETEDELFRFSRLVDSTPALRAALADQNTELGGRQALVDDLLTGRAGPATVVLAKRAVSARERTFAHTIEGFVTLAAAQKNRIVATVRVARSLSAEQRDRLQASLSKQAGRAVALQEILDPSVLGGIRVELGDEVVEGTVAGRLQSARRMFD